MKLVHSRTGVPFRGLRRSMLLLSCVLGAAAAMALAPASIGASDVTPPALVQMINAVPATMNAGDTVGVTAQIADDLSGVKSATLLLTNPASTGRLYHFTLTSGDQLDGEYAAVVSLPNPAVTGTWTVDLQLEDNALNQTSLRLGTIVVGGTSDTTPPSLDSFSLDKTTTSDLANGPDTVTATLHVSDAGSGLSLCQVTLIAPSANQQVHKDVFCSGPVATAVFQLPRYSRPGTWKPFVTLFDKAGNDANFMPFGSDLQVVDSNPDTAPPTLGTPGVSPATVDAGETPQFVSITGNGSDDLSGVSSITIHYDSPSLIQRVEITRLGFPADIEIPPFAEAGSWTGFVDVSDHVGNVARFDLPPIDVSKTVSGNLNPGDPPFTTDTSGAGATLTNPVQAAISIPTDAPNGGPVSIAITTTTTVAPPGYGLFPLEFDITAPDQTFATPLRFTFELYSSLIPAGGISAIYVFRNGAFVPDCLVPAAQAFPDPCVESRTLLGDNARITVLTSAASRWSFGTNAELTATPPSNIELPSISGTAKAGETLTATTGAWAGTEPISYSYQWERCTPGCEDVGGAYGPTLLLGPADVGATLRVEVTADNTLLAGGGTATAESLDSSVVQPLDPPEDSTAPTVMCVAGDGLWHADNVSIACTAGDNGSGLANSSDAAFSLSTSVAPGEENGNASTGTRQVCDEAGNCTTAGPITGNEIDRKAPALSLPAGMTVNATSPAGATVSFSASASDGAHPNPGMSCTPASGSVFPIGTTTVACTATDHVGNQSSGSFGVSLLGAKAQLGQLIQKVVNASTLPPAVKTQLIATLQSRLPSFDPSKPAQRAAVCTALQVFKVGVNALSGRGISPAKAAEWIADATRIRAVLSC